MNYFKGKALLHKACLFLLILKASYAEESTFPLTGNLSLPASQQPSPLVSFGENILDKGNTILYLFADGFIGHNEYFTDVIPSLLYGIRDDLSLFLNVPFSPGNQVKKNTSCGIEDVFVQLEYAFYATKTPFISDQATFVTNVTFPTGSNSKNPPTGFGSCSFFIGSTFNHTETNWFFFASPGVIFTTSHHNTKTGNQFLYQMGFGRNIPSPQGWIFAWLLELDGQYYSKNKSKGSKDPNSGGNVVYATPSLWISSKRFIIQLGVGYPFIQHWFGNQANDYLSFDFNFGVTF